VLTQHHTPAAPAAEATRTEVHIRVVAVPAAVGRVIYAAIEHDELIVACGFRDGDVLRSLSAGIVMSAALWPQLRQEIDALLAGTS
jgi:phosphoribosylformylglycinamidine (FGAM) synthase-like amidotransferase family enzyme